MLKCIPASVSVCLSVWSLAAQVQTEGKVAFGGGDLNAQGNELTAIRVKENDCRHVGFGRTIGVISMFEETFN